VTLDRLTPTRTWVAATFALVLSLGLARLAVTSPRLAVGAAGVLVLVTVVLRSLLAGVVIFTVLTFPTSLPSSLGTATISKPLGLLILLSWLLRLAARERDRPFLARDQPLLTGLVVAYTVWAIASAVWAIDPEEALTTATRLVQVVILLFVVYSSVRTPRDLQVIAWAYVIAAALTSAYALASGVASAGRLTGGIVNSNFLASELVVAIILGAFMLTAAAGLRTRLLLLGMLTTCGIAFVRTGSREGVVALVLGFIVAIFLAGPHRSRIVAMIFIVSAVGVTYYAKLAPESLRVRVTSLSSQDSAGRTDLWRVALRVGEHRPVTGTGLGNFALASPRYAATTYNLSGAQYALGGLVVHNMYIETFSELGVVGLVLFLGIIVAALAAAGRGIRRLARGDPAISVIARGLLAGTIGLLVAYAFSSGQYQKQPWILFGLLAATQIISLRAGADPRRGRELEPGEMQVARLRALDSAPG